MFLGVQVVSIALLLSIAIGFKNVRRLPILSTRWYERFLNAAIANLGIEFIALCALYNIERFPEWVVQLCYRLFIVSLILLMHCFLMFLEIKGRNQRRFSKKELFPRTIIVLSIVPVVIFGDIQLFVDGMVRYPYGSMLNGLYIFMVIYIVSYFLLIWHFKNSFTQREVATLIFGLTSWLVVLVLQIVFPFMLLTSMGVALMAMHVFMSFENPRELADQEIPHALNKNAFLTLLNEHIQSKEDFYIVSMTLTNSQMLKDAKGYNEAIKYVESAAIYLSYFAPGQLVYHPKRDVVCLIFKSKEKYYAFMEEQRELFAREGHGEYRSGKYFVSILKCPQYASTVDEVVAIMDYVDKNKGDIKEKILRIDESVLEKRTRLADVEKLVQKAIETDGFDVYYQPIYSNKDKRFVSAEALVRLTDTETLGYVSPEVFIPIAEENGMICEVGKIVFRKVCKFISEYNLANYGIEYIEVNLSGVQFMDDKLNEILSGYVKEYNVPPEFINLEITETASIEIGEMLEYNMKRLKECRFRFSMDDFGTGYSNLAQMAQADFDLIKLDKSLLWPCFGENASLEAKVILNACIQMIHDLGKQIVAEGVETEEMVNYLTERGVCYLQGFYFAKPLPSDKYLEFMEKVK